MTSGIVKTFIMLTMNHPQPSSKIIYSMTNHIEKIIMNAVQRLDGDRFY